MLFTRRQIDRKAAAQRVEARRRARKAAARDDQRIDKRAGQRRPSEARQLGIDEGEVEFGVVDDQPVTSDKRRQLVGEVGEGKLVGQEFRRQTVHRQGIGRDVAVGIDIAVEFSPGRHMVHQLDAGDLDDAVSVIRVEPGRFGIDHDLAHRHSLAYLRRRANPLRRGLFP